MATYLQRDVYYNLINGHFALHSSMWATHLLIAKLFFFEIFVILTGYAEA